MKSQQSYQAIREYPRFKANHRALVLQTQTKEALPYHVIDIGKGGLSFRYLGRKLKPSEIDKLNLYYDQELIVDSIPVEQVFDYRLRDNIVPVRRFGVRFNGLTGEQQQKLNVFIQNHTEITH